MLGNMEAGWRLLSCGFAGSTGVIESVEWWVDKTI